MTNKGKKLFTTWLFTKQNLVNIYSKDGKFYMDYLTMNYTTEITNEYALSMAWDFVNRITTNDTPNDYIILRAKMLLNPPPAII